MLCRICLVAVASLFFLSGCGETSGQKYYEEGRLAIENGYEDRAQALFLKAIAVDDLAEAHFEYAKLVAKDEKNAGLAAWHCRRCVEKTASSGCIEDVKNAVELAEKLERTFVDYTLRGLGEESFEERKAKLALIEEHDLKLKQELQLTKQENAMLRRELGGEK